MIKYALNCAYVMYFSCVNNHIVADFIPDLRNDIYHNVTVTNERYRTKIDLKVFVLPQLHDLDHAVDDSRKND